jgi:DNA-binding GntR family transcriptional regulator
MRMSLLCVNLSGDERDHGGHGTREGVKSQRREASNSTAYEVRSRHSTTIAPSAEIKRRMRGQRKKPSLTKRKTHRLTKPQLRAERIYQTLRRQICLLDLPPGMVLREQDLADQFKVSRSPIRYVMSRLAGDGLVASRQGVGTTVTTLYHEDLLDTYYVRAILAESIGDSDPVPPAEGVIEELKVLSRRCNTIEDAIDVRAFGEINIEFHSLILTIVRNQVLRELSDQLFYRTARIWFQLLPRISWRNAVGDMRQEIDQVTQAMKRGDLKAVGLIHRNHIFTVMTGIRELLDDDATAAEGD